MRSTLEFLGNAMAYGQWCGDGAVDEPPTTEQNAAGHSRSETFVTVYRTLLAERRAEAQIGGCQILQSDGLRYAAFRHVVVMDA